MSMYVGESLVGDGNEVAHIDLLIGDKGGPVGTAFANALADTTIPAPATQTPVATAAPAETTTKPKSTATPVQPPNPPVPSKAKVRVKAAKVPTVTLDEEV